MASYVVKAQFGDSLRRLTLSGNLALSFAQLESRTRDLFNLPSSAQLVLTYVDKDGDVVTMSEDQDLRDALVLQSLNPLRLSVAILPSADNVSSDVKKSDPKKADAPVPGSATGQSDSPSEGIKQAEAEKSAADVNAESISEPASAEKVADTKAPASLDEGAAAGDAENKEQPNVEKEDQVIHHGITCDDCGVTPIAGPRFKSCKKSDYDLCRACFEKPAVNPNDYFMVERRFRRPDPRFPFWGGRMMRSNPAFDSRNPNSRNARATAECARSGSSRCRGAEAVRPAASGSGQATPPAGDQEKKNANGSASDVVVHHGVECDVCKMNPITGPRFTSKMKFNYDLCSGCFKKNDDGVKTEYCRIDRSVHGIHPEVLRWYRMVSPYGSPICGRGIWILNRMAKEHAQAQKKEAEDQQGARTSETSAAPEASSKEATPTSTEKQAEVSASSKQESVANKKTSTLQANSEREVRTAPVPASGVQNENAAPIAPKEDLSTFDTLLAKLAAMGFTDNQLNEELLKKNQMDLRKTVDDLCSAEEWDPILEELQEMGFYDNDLNRRLLLANNGSVKRVVKELVQKAKKPATATAKEGKQA